MDAANTGRLQLTQLKERMISKIMALRRQLQEKALSRLMKGIEGFVQSLKKRHKYNEQLSQIILNEAQNVYSKYVSSS